MLHNGGAGGWWEVSPVGRRRVDAESDAAAAASDLAVTVLT